MSTNNLTRLCALIVLLIASATIGCGNGTGQFPLVSASVINPPTINELSPTSAPVGSPSFTMEVIGSNFTTDAVVFWKETPLHTAFINSKELLVQVTDTDMQMAGPIAVFVRASAQNSNSVNFNVLIQ